jgi:hypothetical protein
MKKTASVLLISLLSLCFSGAGPALATPVTDLLDAASSNAEVVGFESQTTGLPILWAIGDGAFRATGNFTVDLSMQTIHQQPQFVHSKRPEPLFRPHDFPRWNRASGAIWSAFDYPGEINYILTIGHCRPQRRMHLMRQSRGIAFTNKGYDYLMAALTTMIDVHGSDVLWL